MKLFDHWQILMVLTLVFIQIQETVLSVHDVKNQSINEQKCALSARFVNSILYLFKNSRNAILKYEHIIAAHISSISIFKPELYRQCCTDFIKYNVEHQK